MEELGIRPGSVTESTPESSASLFIPRSTIQPILDSTTQSALKSALQSIPDSGDQLILKSTIHSIFDSTHPGPELTPESTPEQTPDTRPIWSGSHELIQMQHLAEKGGWLSSHPTVRPSTYRQKSGLEAYN
jgi:hypothetical protein